MGRLLRPAALAAGVLATTLIVAGCATPPTDPAARAEFEKTNDPLEPLNRRIFKNNMRVEKHVLRPIGKAYKKVVPEFLRNRVRDFSNNYASPVTFINDVLQGKGGRAAETAVRFVVNTVAGIGGLFDVAGQYGLKRHTEDFGQTLAVWGFKSGPYLVLPILGPSSVRHTIGRGVDAFSNPFSYVTGDSIAVQFVFGARGALGFLDEYSRNIQRIEDLEKDSVDWYATVRSLYRQHRESEIKDGKVDKIPLPGDDE